VQYLVFKHALGTPIQPADIIKAFEEEGGTVLNGLWGVNPIVVEKYLKDKGYDTDIVNFPNSDKIDDRIRNSNASIIVFCKEKVHTLLPFKKTLTVSLTYTTMEELDQLRHLLEHKLPLKRGLS
jgi:hypothetical protein